MKRHLLGILLAGTGMGLMPTHGADLYFRPAPSGNIPQNGQTYTWDTTTANWYDALSGGTAGTWNNATPDRAFIPADNSPFTIQLATDITTAGLFRAGVSPSTGTTAVIRSVDPGSRSTLTFAPGGIVNFNTTSTRFLRFQDILINGDFALQGSGVVLGANIGFSNSTITNSGSLYLNVDTTADVVLDNGEVLVNTDQVRTGVARLSGSGTISRSGAGSGGSFNLTQADNTTLTGRFSAPNVVFRKHGEGTFIMNGGGTQQMERNIEIHEGAFYTDGSISSIAGSGAPHFNVEGEATFGGTATVNRSVTLVAADSILAPGLPTLDGSGNVENHAGTLILANGVTAANGGTFNFFLDENDGGGGLLNSLIEVTGGTVTLSGTKTVNLFDLGAGLLQQHVAYTLFDATGASSLTAGWNSNWVIGSNDTGLDAVLGFSGDQLQVVFVPEPSTYVFLILGLAVLGVVRMRRKDHLRA